MANTIQKESKVVYLQIGQNYEHLAENKQFDVSEWVSEFPDATIYMLFKRPGEAAVAPVQTTLEDGILTWTISNWETGIIGIGFAEIRAIDQETGMVKKSHVIPCSIEESVTAEDDVPEYPSWVDRMITMNEHLESVYSDFNQEITDGIAAIQGEAGIQKDAIQDKGAEVIASIPASYQTVLESIAPQYASGRPWPKDWFCWYNGKLYQHREDETVAGEFDPDKWYQVVFSDVASEATISAKDTRTALYDIAAPEYVTWRSYHTDDYDPAEAFPAIAVGDYYIFDLQMYRCIVPIPVGGDTWTWADGTLIARKFVPEHWERVAVYTELQRYVQSDALAPEYSASTTYKAGQYVWYSGNVYRCKTDISTAEAWTAAHWQLVKIGDELTDLKSALNYDIENGSTQLFPDLTTWYNGYLGSDGVLVSAGSVISPTSAPIKLAQDQKVVVNCGTLVCGVSYFRYNVDMQKYTRHYSVDQTNKFDVISDGDNFYYGLTFKKSPQTTITPNEFNGYIGQYTDWRLKIDENATKLSADGMVEVFTDLTQWNAGYFGSKGVITSSSYRCTPLSTPFLLYAGDTIEIDPGTFSCGVAVYTYTSGTYARQSSTSYTEKTTITYATDKYISFDFGKTPAGQTPATDFTGYIKYSVAWKTKIYNNSSRISALETTAASGNYLAGKKVVACGDSITAAVNPGGGNFDSYARLTAQRNGMTFDLNAVSGSTMTNVSGRNPFCVDRYQQIPSDFDYLTIWFGFNDGAYAQVGTINDTEDTTFYGAYKKVMDYYLATYPTKKIGLIVPYMSNAAFQQAVRDISEMYGVPCLDLHDYNQCSIVWGDANAAQSARKSALTYDGTHPNQTGHEFISTMYEAFLRRL